MFWASDEDFIRVWQTSDSCKEVAEKFKVPLLRVYSRGMRLRVKGVPLKIMARGRRGIDYAALAKLAESLAEKKPKKS